MRRPLVLVAALSALLLFPTSALALGTLDQSQTNLTNIQAFGSTFFNAQVFTAGLTGQLDQVDVLLLRNGMPADDVSVEVWTVTGDAPASPLPGASATVTAADVPTANTHTWVTVPINAPSVAGTKYAIVLSSPGSLSDDCGNSICWYWASDSNAPYTAGPSQFSPDSGVTWAPPVGFDTDFAFKTYVTVAATDADGDGVADGDDLCAGTVLPDPAPPSPQKNHYRANASGDFIDVKTGANSGTSLEDTGGCSAAQIVVAAGLGKGHTKNGISGEALNAWVASH